MNAQQQQVSAHLLQLCQVNDPTGSGVVTIAQFKTAIATAVPDLESDEIKELLREINTENDNVAYVTAIDQIVNEV